MSETITACQNICSDFAWVAPVTEWLRNLAIVLGVFVAWRQLGQWRTEKVAVKRSELGEELISVSNEIFFKIKSIRSPFGYRPPDGEVDDGTFDFVRRLNELAALDDEFAKLSQLKVRARAWQDDASLANSIEALFEARVKLILGLKGMIRHTRGELRHGRKHLAENTAERVKRYEALIWEDEDQDIDPINSLIEPALKDIEARLIPLIRLELKH